MQRRVAHLVPLVQVHASSDQRLQGAKNPLPPAGVEPATLGLLDPRSNRLSYGGRRLERVRGRIGKIGRRRWLRQRRQQRLEGKVGKLGTGQTRSIDNFEFLSVLTAETL